jgi:pimeloyl-ACP methyl ester carboxylesterase
MGEVAFLWSCIVIAGCDQTAETNETPVVEDTTAVSGQARSGYAEVNGLRLYYEIHGEGRPLVLLHGAYMSIESMKPILDRLAKDRQVVALESQGHGRTADIDRPITYEQMADDVAAAMVDLGIEQADVFGYSMGGGTALQLAIRHPARVRRLVVASASYETQGMYPELLPMFEQMTPATFAGSPFEAEYKRLAPNPENFPVLVEKLLQLDTTPQSWPADDIAGIAAPTLVISGDADVIRPEHSVEIFRLLGGGPTPDFMGASEDQLAILPGASHLGVIEEVDLLMTIVPEFLDRESAE